MDITEEGTDSQKLVEEQGFNTMRLQAADELDVQMEEFTRKVMQLVYEVESLAEDMLPSTVKNSAL